MGEALGTALAVIAAVGGGAAIGAVLGGLGGGGSVLAVPVLLLLGLTVDEAATGSLVVVGAAAVLSATGHRRAGGLDLRTGLVLGLAGAPGALLGARLAGRVEDDVALLCFASVVLVAAAFLAGGRADEDDEVLAAPGARRLVAIPVAGSAIGLLAGFLGVGGGFVVLPVLVLLLGLPVRRAVGTSLVVIATNSALALVARLASGDGAGLAWHVVGPFAAGALLASPLATRLSHRVPARLVARSFAVLLLGVGILLGTRGVLGLT